jgi:hypothetical protein
MRKLPSIVVAVVVLVVLAVPAHASTRVTRISSFAKALRVWLQGKLSPPWPAPEPAPVNADAKRTTS